MAKFQLTEARTFSLAQPCSSPSVLSTFRIFYLVLLLLLLLLSVSPLSVHSSFTSFLAISCLSARLVFILCLVTVLVNGSSIASVTASVDEPKVAFLPSISRWVAVWRLADRDSTLYFSISQNDGGTRWGSPSAYLPAGFQTSDPTRALALHYVPNLAGILITFVAGDGNAYNIEVGTVSSTMITGDTFDPKPDLFNRLVSTTLTGPNTTLALACSENDCILCQSTIRPTDDSCYYAYVNTDGFYVFTSFPSNLAPRNLSVIRPLLAVPATDKFALVFLVPYNSETLNYERIYFPLIVGERHTSPTLSGSSNANVGIYQAENPSLACSSQKCVLAYSQETAENGTWVVTWMAWHIDGTDGAPTITLGYYNPKPIALSITIFPANPSMFLFVSSDFNISPNLRWTIIDSNGALAYKLLLDSNPSLGNPNNHFSPTLVPRNHDDTWAVAFASFFSGNTIVAPAITGTYPASLKIWPGLLIAELNLP